MHERLSIIAFIEKFDGSCYLSHVPCTGEDRCATKEDYVLSLMVDAAGAAERGVSVVTPVKDATSEAQLDRILSSLDDDKAEDVVQIDLRGKSAMADYMVICSGRSSRQVSAISQKLADRLKQEFGILCKTEGKDSGDWVLIDTGDVIVHVFRPEVREFYQLEKMWLPAGQAASAES